jgi:hypothetical protein
VDACYASLASATTTITVTKREFVLLLFQSKAKEVSTMGLTFSRVWERMVRKSCCSGKEMLV